MNIVKGVYVLSEKEKERRLANHKTQLKKIANRRNSFQLIELQNNNSKSNETSSKLSLDSIAKSNKIILNRINNTTTATNKMPAVNYDYLSLKKLNVTLEGY